MSDRMPISEAEALDMLAECFDADASGLRPDTPRDSIAGWDSMGALMLMAELDERFSLELSADNSRAMKSIRDALDFMREHGVLREQA